MILNLRILWLVHRVINLILISLIMDLLKLFNITLLDQQLVMNLKENILLNITHQNLMFIL